LGSIIGPWMNFLGASPPALAPCRATNSQFQPRADQHHGRRILFSNRGGRAGARRIAGGCRANRALGHAHGGGKECRSSRPARANVVVGLGIGPRPLPRMIRGRLALFSTSSGARFDGCGAPEICAGRRVDHLDQRVSFRPSASITCPEQLGRQIEIDAARAARDGGRGSRRRQANADIGGRAARGTPPCTAVLQSRAGPSPRSPPCCRSTISRSDEPRDQDHRKTVGGGVRQSAGQAVEEAGEPITVRADAGFSWSESRRLTPHNRRSARGGTRLTRMPGCPAPMRAEVRDRDAGHAVDGVETVKPECIDDQIKAIGLLALFGCDGVDALCYLRTYRVPSLVVSCYRRVLRLPDAASQNRRALKTVSWPCAST